MSSVLVTGASGFVGRPTCFALRDRGFSVRAFTRMPCEWPSGIQSFTTSSLSELEHSSAALQGLDCILHLAGRAHVIKETDPEPLAAYRTVNVNETLKLAREAALAGVRRFVFVSSIKVNGESSVPLAPFTEKDVANPIDAYGISKYEAELGLHEIAAETGIQVVIVRPPLIYGLGVKGNFRLMMKLLARKTPLPLALITGNRRSLVSLDNFIDFLTLCVSHPKAAGRVFLVSDQHDVSTADLLLRLGGAMGFKARLFPVPPALLLGAAKFTRNYSTYQRLCGSLAVDGSAGSRLLGWVPPLSLDEGLRRAGKDFVD